MGLPSLLELCGRAESVIAFKEYGRTEGSVINEAGSWSEKNTDCRTAARSDWLRFSIHRKLMAHRSILSGAEAPLRL